MPCNCCQITDKIFDEKDARSGLRRYQRRGPSGQTLELLKAVRSRGLKDATLLDIGGGVGAVHHELLRSGAARAVDVDASRAYTLAAHEEAERQGHADRIRYVTGDFVAVADEIDAADLVALDRVICCYADMAALVGRSAPLARRRYGLVYLRDSWLGRVGVALENARFRVSRSPFRTYVHRTAEVEAILAAHGLVKRLERRTLIWQLALYERPEA